MAKIPPLNPTEMSPAAFLEKLDIATGAELAGTGDDAAEFATSAGRLRVESWSPRMLRVTLGGRRGADYGIVTGRATPERLSVRKLGDSAGTIVAAGRCELHIGSDPLRLAFSVDGRTLLAPPTDSHFTRKFRIAPLAASQAGTVVAFELGDDEKIYGFGEKWSSLDKRGELVGSHNSDSLGGNAESSYMNIPLAWSSRGWGVFFSTPAPSMHSVGFAPVGAAASAIRCNGLGTRRATGADCALLYAGR